MEYRKLISFGRSSYVVSLPKTWVERNKLKKGDLIYLNEKSNEIILNPKLKERNEITEITIETDGKALTLINREITTAYINDFNVINVIGKDLTKNAKKIRAMLQNLMALEIVEETATKIIARDFLNIKQISIHELLRKIDIITRDMIIDSKQTPKKDRYENIYQRDEDINRLSYLLYRVIRYALNNPNIAKSFEMNEIELLDIWRIVYCTEKIADEVKRIAKYLRLIKLGKKEAEKLTALYTKIEQLYLNTMKAHYTKNKKLAFEVADEKNKIIEECKDIINEYPDKLWFANAVEKMKNMTFVIGDLGRTIYT